MNKHRGQEKADDEQLHVLPLYIPAKSNEHGSEEAQRVKQESGVYDVLQKYPVLMRFRKKSLPNCKDRNKRLSANSR